MKKLIVGIMCFILMVVFGCAGVQLDQGKATEVMVNILSRRLALKVYQNNPTKVDEIEFYCKALVSGDITQAAINVGIGYLTENFGDDPLFESDIRDLSKLIVIDTADPKFDPGLIKVIAQGFIDAASLVRIKGVVKASQMDWQENKRIADKVLNEVYRNL